MKTTNLKSIVDIYEKDENKDLSQEYLNYLGSNIKLSDLISLKSLVNSFYKIDKSLSVVYLSNFYISYNIPQIGKEFDLLKVSDNLIINIEYKQKYTENVKKQLLKNRYYLNFLDKNLFIYTYIAENEKVYKLDQNNNLTETDIAEVIDIIKKQSDEEYIYTDDLDLLFKPSNYLISPFNKTEQFINEEYFLTQEQEEIKNNIDTEIQKNNKYFLITGSAGSGKTLLTYHIAHEYMKLGIDVAIIHVGHLNNGHIALKEDYKWNIQPIKFWDEIFTNNNSQIVIIDESQRMNNKYQFEKIMNKIVEKNITLIMSGDKKQTLGNNEGWAIDTENIIRFSLSKKIRTNKELVNFLRTIFDLKRKNDLKPKNKNVNVLYFDKLKDAKQYIKANKNYNYISYTPNTGNYSPLCKAHSLNFSDTGTSHEVVGQEFENVLVVLDNHFYYDEDKKLKAYKIQHNPYHPLKMFYQQITRTINKLEIVVIGNIELFNNIISIFDTK
ncbi:ATP-binding protein [bacterium]|nr:ATP-binding protein [bacterium]